MTEPSGLRGVLQIVLELFRDVWSFGAFGQWLAESAHSLSLRTAFGAIAGLYLIVCAYLIALRLTRWLLPRAGLPLHFSTVFGVGMWCSTVGFHALLAWHAFKLSFALLGCTALTLTVLRGVPAEHASLRREYRRLRALVTCAKRSRHVAINGCFLSFAIVLTLRALVIPPLGWDTVTYHAPRAALWVSSGQFTFDEGVGSYDFYRHFFSGGEVLSAWAMLPFSSDLLANLGSVCQWLGVFFASWALARALGLREPYAATSAGVVTFLPALQLEVNSGYVELALNAALIQGIALAVHCLKRRDRSTIPAAVLCAMSLGVAAGIKLPALPPALIAGAALALRVLASRRIAWRLKLMAAGPIALCALLPPLPFMIRAYLDTGYPLSPMPVRLFGQTLGVASRMVAWCPDRPELQPHTWPVEKQSLSVIFAPLSEFNEAIGGLGMLPILVFPLGLALLLRRKPWTGLWLACAALAPVLAHFGTELSAVRLTRPASSTRFLIPFMALVVPISLYWCSRRGLLSQSYRRCLLVYPLGTSLLAFRRGFGAWETRDLCAIAFVVIALYTLLRWLQLRAARVNARMLLVAVAAWALLVCVLQVRRDQTRDLAMHKSYALHEFPHHWADAVHWVDEPDLRPHRIAITGGPDHSSDKWFQYFFFGRRFQNSLHYIPPTRDGAVAQFGPGGDLNQRADLPSWFSRVQAAQISEVLTFPQRSIEQQFMDQNPQLFEKLQGGRDWGLYRVIASEKDAQAN